MENDQDSVLIAGLNDILRMRFLGGRVMLTKNVSALEEDVREAVIQAVKRFNTFTVDNDPHGEHDFGAVEVHGQRFFWKIDYYNKTLYAGSDDPADPKVTTRVLTIMQASEY